MRFLDICVQVRQECGISGIGPTSVLNQSGEMLRIVNWVQSAWTEIQEMREWRWMWAASSVNLTAGGRIYDPINTWGWNVHDWDYETLRVYSTALGIQDEMFITFMPWEDFKLSYNIGTIFTQRPQIITRRPDELLVFNFALDQAYTFSGEYFLLPTALVANADVPAMPARFHELITWKACMYYAEYEEAGALLLEMKKRFNRMLNKLEEIQLPVIQMAKPLA